MTHLPTGSMPSTMLSDYCGSLSGAPDDHADWHAALQSAAWSLLRESAGDPAAPAACALLLPPTGSEFQVFNDGRRLGALRGTPYFLGSADANASCGLSEIIALVEAEGPAALSRLGGSFALALGFPARGELVLAVDRFAVENLFYVATERGIAYSTRARMLADHPRVQRRFETQTVFDYLYFHCVPGPATGFAHLARLLPGHYLHFANGRAAIAPYWQPHYAEDLQTDPAALAARLPGLLESAVARRLRPGAVACFLSGGLDSSSVTGMCARLAGGDVTAFTIGFDAHGYDEMEFARSVADHFHVRHAHYYVKPTDIADALPAILAAMDGPFGNASAVPTYFCAKLARDHGFTSMMAGDGGDELFGGNSRYATQLLFDHYQRIPGVLRHGLLEPVAAALPAWAKVSLLGKAASYIRQAAVPLPDRLQTYNLLNWLRPESFLTPDFLADIDPAAPLRTLHDMYRLEPRGAMVNELLHLDWRLTLADSDLPKVCRASALAGIDVQYPMLDETLFDFAAALPVTSKVTGRVLRPLYREAFKDFLPRSTLTKSKQGFGLPFGVWLRENAVLKEFTSAHLQTLEQAKVLQPGFRERFLSGQLQEHPAYFGVLVWILLALGIWFEQSRVTLVHGRHT